MAPNLTPPPLARLHRAQTLVHVREYAQAMHALAAPNTLVAPLVETIATLHHLHPLPKVDLPPFVDNFHPKTNLVLDKKAFISTLTCSPYLSSSGPSSMVYELL